MTGVEPKYKTISPFDLTSGDNPGAIISQPKANITQVAPTANATTCSTKTPLTEADRQGLSGFTDDQWRTIQRVFGSSSQTADRLKGKNINPVWILDTGATHHMTGCAELLHDIRNITPVHVTLPAREDVISTQQGTVFLTPQLCLKNVYLVPDFHINLISLGQLVTDHSLVVQLTDKLLILQDRTSRMLIGAGEREGEGLYQFIVLDSVFSNQSRVNNKRVDNDLWHKRLGHASYQAIESISGVASSPNDRCSICLQAKQTRQSFPISSNKATTIFDLVHCDLWGPYRVPSTCGSRYFLTIVDDCSRAVWIYLIQHKDRVALTLRNFLAMVKRQFNKKIKTIRSDNGTEFLCMSKYFQEKGIIHETSCVYTPQQNGRVERKHRHILEVARALRFQARFPIEFWGHCVLTAAYLINRTPSRILHGKTPFSVLYGRKPSYKHLKTLGCLAFAHNPHTHGDKFESRSRQCVLVGYPHGTKGWRLYDLNTNVFFVSRDVVFQETEFPFSKIAPPDAFGNSLTNSNIDTPIEEDPNTPTSHTADQAAATGPLEATGPTDETGPIDEDIPLQPASSDDEADLVGTNVADGPVTDAGLVHEHHDPSPPVVHDSNAKRVSKPPAYLKDYVVGTISVNKEINPLPSSPPASPQHLSGTSYPLSQYLSSHRFSPSFCCYLVQLSAKEEPRSFKEAIKHDEWRLAMQSEVDSLEQNHTWDLVDLPSGKEVIGSQWVFRLKLHADGSLERHKARVVALGNHQIEGVNYTETFAPVAKMTTIRLLLDIAAKKNYEVHQMDVHNAFLHGDLEEEIYMKPPPGFSANGDKRVCRLRKSIYGLKQSPRCWFAKLADALQRYGFTQTKSDYSLFVFNHNTVIIYILVYVDDLIISGNSTTAIQEFKDYLSTCFKMKDLGPARYFLGLEIARSSDGFYVCQRKYALDILTEMGLLGCKPAGSPMDQNHKLGLATDEPLSNPEPYRRLIGRLVYLASTRPDLSYAVHVLSQFMQKPQAVHWDAALQVVRYLKGTVGQGILLSSKTPLTLTGWCDSDWAGCPQSRKSLTGWLVQLGNSPISWKTKKQTTVSCSSAEAEYRAMAALCREVRWLKVLLGELGITHDSPISLRCDSQAALHISANPVFHERTKHIEVDCHYVRECILDGTVKPGHVSTKDQLADILTKALGRKEYRAFLDKLGIHNLHAPT